MTYDTNPTVPGCNTVSNGYGKYWYLRSLLRWATMVVAVSDLITFGVIWSQVVDFDRISLFGLWIFAILAPLLSFVTSVYAIVLLFLLRKGRCFNPGWLLSFDLFVILVLVVTLVFTWPTYWNQPGYSGQYWNPTDALRTPWRFNIAVACLHVVALAVDAYEVNVFRRASRQRRLDVANARVKDLEDAANDDPDVSLGTTNNIELRSMKPSGATTTLAEVSDTQRLELPEEGLVEAPDTPIQVELPDGRTYTLPPGSRLKMPRGLRTELPGSSSRAPLAELDSPVSGVTQWEEEVHYTKS